MNGGRSERLQSLIYSAWLRSNLFAPFARVAKISGFAASNRAVNLSELATSVSANLICRVAFGKRYDEQGEEMGRLLHDVQTLMVSFFVSDFFPAFGWVDKLTCNKLDSFYQQLIDEHVDPSRVKMMEEEEDFLDTLIRIKEENSSPVDLTWDRIKLLLMNIFIAATESSAASMVWIMTALMKEAGVMAKVVAEIRNNSSGKLVDEEDLPKLDYLKAVINDCTLLLHCLYQELQWKLAFCRATTSHLKRSSMSMHGPSQEIPSIGKVQTNSCQKDS